MLPRPDPSGELQAATATGLIATRHLMGVHVVTSSSPWSWSARSGPSRSPASVIGHCQRRFRQGDSGRSVPDPAARPARGMPPEGPRSPRAARRGEARQAARSRSDAPVPPASGNDRPGNERNRTAPPRTVRARRTCGNRSRPSRNAGRAEDCRQEHGKLSRAFEAQASRSLGAKRARPARAATPPKAAGAGGMGAQRPCAGRFRGREARRHAPGCSNSAV